MPAPTLPEMLADLRASKVTVEEAEDMLVELIEWRRIDGVERWKIGRELDKLAKEVSPTASPPCSG